MKSSRVISVRLSAEDFDVLEREAARHDKSVSTFARDRMMSHVRWNGDLQALRSEVLQHIAGGPKAAGEAPGGEAIDRLLLEAVMLLRRASPPQTIAQVHGEMSRRGVTAYQGGEG